MRQRTLVLATILVVSLAAADAAGPVAQAQDPAGAGQVSGAGQGGGRGGQYAGMQRVGGEVTAVAGANITVKTEDGATMQIVTTDNTRVMKGRGVTVKVADLKVGDGVIGMGNLDAPNKTLHAAMVMATDAAQIKAMRDNLGKTYITGKVTAIDADNAKMTVERPDKVSQTIGFDETTSFKKGGRGGMPVNGMMGGGMGPGGGDRAGRAPAGGDDGESITLADIKVGDNVRGTGTVKAGVFVPAQLVVVVPPTGGGRRRGESAGGPPPAGGPTGF
jgi:hypothetical protein